MRSNCGYQYAGTSVLVNRAKVAEPKIIRFNLDTDSESEEHDPNGRVILLRFKHFALLHTYRYVTFKYLQHRAPRLPMEQNFATKVLQLLILSRL